MKRLVHMEAEGTDWVANSLLAAVTEEVGAAVRCRTVIAERVGRIGGGATHASVTGAAGAEKDAAVLGTGKGEAEGGKRRKVRKRRAQERGDL